MHKCENLVSEHVWYINVMCHNELVIHTYILVLTMVLKLGPFNEPKKGEVQDFWGQAKVQPWSNCDVSFNIFYKIFLVFKLVYIY